MCTQELTINLPKILACEEWAIMIICCPHHEFDSGDVVTAYRRYCLLVSPRARLHVAGMLLFVANINQPSLPTPFCSVLVSISVCMALSTAFYSVNYPDNSLFLTLFFRS